MKSELETRGTRTDQGWRDHDGFIGPIQPGTGPRSDPRGDFPTGPEVGEALPDVRCSTADATAPEAVRVNIELDGSSLAATVQRGLVARFSVPAGRHVYAEPAPQGMVAADVVLNESDRLVQRPIVRPASQSHVLAGTGESFQVHHALFELRLPLTVNNAAGDVDTEITVSGEVRWQSCDDEVCDIPTSKRFELTLPVAKSPAVALWGKEGAALEPNAIAHFQRMSERRGRAD